MIALGFLGWTEYEYYTCSPEGFYYACKGHFARMRIEENWHRVIAHNTYILAGGKEKNIDRYWKIDSQTERVTPKIDPELHRKLWDSLKGHKKKDK